MPASAARDHGSSNSVPATFLRQLHVCLTRWSLPRFSSHRAAVTVLQIVLGFMKLYAIRELRITALYSLRKMRITVD